MESAAGEGGSIFQIIVSLAHRGLASSENRPPQRRPCGLPSLPTTQGRPRPLHQHTSEQRSRVVRFLTRTLHRARSCYPLQVQQSQPGARDSPCRAGGLPRGRPMTLRLCVHLGLRSPVSGEAELLLTRVPCASARPFVLGVETRDATKGCTGWSRFYFLIGLF